jgi:small GTP-binding protein
MTLPVVQKKVCLLGEFAVGKTSLVRRFVEGRFDDRYLTTIGVKISRHSLAREGHTLNLLLWDLAGSEEFNGAAASHLLGAAGALVVCDLVRPETVETLVRYAVRLRAANPDAAVVLAANKRDLVDERRVSDADLAAASALLSGPYLLTSAKTGENVERAFELLADAIEGRP